MTILCEHWRHTTKFDPAAAYLADGHYSRRTIGSPQYMPPGQTVCLITRDQEAVFGWWRPHPDSGITAMNGLDGWTCTIFRNRTCLLSSELIRDAETALYSLGLSCGPDGLLTYVHDQKTASRRSKRAQPGQCFIHAGWRVHSTRPRSADKKKTLLHKPWGG